MKESKLGWYGEPEPYPTWQEWGEKFYKQALKVPDKKVKEIKK